MSKDKNQELCVCYQCGDALLPSQFQKSYSGLYVGTGHLPICKNCFEKKFNVYLAEYGDSKQALKRMCMAFDLYFNDKLFDACEDDTTLISKYFRKLNMVQYKGKTFDTTIAEGFDFFDNARNPKPKVEEVSEDEVAPEDILKWGQGLEPVDYDNLNNHYKLLKAANPNCNSNQEAFISDLCYAKMQQLRAARERNVDDFKKMGDYYNATFIKAGLKAIKEVEANADDCLGTWLARISQYTPEEYYKNKTLYKDHDGIGDYITRFVFRPLKNLMFGSNERDSEYCVKDEVDEDDYSDSDTE